MTPPNTKSETPDFKKEISELKTEFMDKVARMETNTNSLTTKINEQLSAVNSLLAQQLAGPKKEEALDEAITIEEGDDSWYDAFKASPDKTVKNWVKPELNKVKSDVKAEVKAEFKKEKEAEKFDNMAYSSFPQLKDENHPLRKATEKILAEYGGDFGNRPSAIYDAARIAYADLVAKNEIVPESFKSEAVRLLRISDSEMLPYRHGTRAKEDDLNDSQKFFARKLGISEDKYKARLKTMGNKRPDRD